MKSFFKAFLITPVVSILFLLGSCGKDDPTPTSANLIVGIWDISKIDVSIIVGTQSFVEYLKDALGLTDAEAQEFEDDLADSITEGESGTLEIKKGGTYAATDVTGDVSTGKWELTSDGKTLTIDKGTADEEVYTVTSLTATKLVLTTDQTETDNGITLKFHLEVELTK